MAQEQVAYVIGGTFSTDEVTRFQLKNAPKIITPDALKVWQKDERGCLIRAVSRPKKLVVGQLLFYVHPHHLEIMSVGVEAEYRRKKVATNLFWRLVTDNRSGVYPSITALCPDDEDAGIALLRHLDFRGIRVIPGEDGERDKYLFTWQRKGFEDHEDTHKIRIADGDSATDWLLGPGEHDQDGYS